jgi:hypothetical protein
MAGIETIQAAPPNTASPATISPSIATRSWSRGVLVGVDVVGLGSNNCLFPTESQYVTYINIVIDHCIIEADKEVQTWTISGGSYPGIVFQSSSIQNLIVENGASIALIGGDAGDKSHL